MTCSGVLKVVKSQLPKFNGERRRELNERPFKTITIQLRP